MLRPRLISGSIALALLMPLMGVPVQAGAAETPTPYIVVLEPGVAPGPFAAQAAEGAGTRVEHVYRHALNGFALRLPPSRVAALEADPRVRFLTRDGVVRAEAQSLPTGVDRVDGDLSSAASGDGSGGVRAPVAVLDTGVGPHPDLNVVGGTTCVGGKNYNDPNGHGTHVAGTAAAEDDTQGVVGVAPGAPIYSVRVLGKSGSSTWSKVICGLDWVDARSPAKGGSIAVVNLSLSGPGADDGSCGQTDGDALHQAICRLVADGVTVVAAAGNQSTDLASRIPAAYDEVLAVTAMNDHDGRPGGLGGGGCGSNGDDVAAGYSNWASAGGPDEGHAIAAPGTCILSTDLRNGYKTRSGTSMATPHVAGAIALCIWVGTCSGLSPSSVAQVIRTDAAARTAPEREPGYGFGGDPTRPIAGRYYGYLLDATY